MQHLIIFISSLADRQDQGPIGASRNRSAIDRLGLEGELLAAASWLEDAMELIGVAKSGDDQHSLSIRIPPPEGGVADRLVLAEAFWETGGNVGYALGFDGGGAKSVGVSRLGE